MLYITAFPCELTFNVIYSCNYKLLKKTVFQYVATVCCYLCECMCVCDCVLGGGGERVRERERMCVCVCAPLSVCVCVHVRAHF